jgi:DNA-binding NarL/FixJ family response regulator
MMKGTMTSAPPISVVVVEDNGELRAGLSLLIQGTPGYTCIGSFASCEQLQGELGSLKTRPPKVVLMDIGLPGMSGIEGVRLIKDHLPGVDVLMLTAFEDDKKIYDSICAGAAGYLLKKTPPVKILEAISEISEGGAAMTSSIARKVLSAFQTDRGLTSSDYQLSDREREVLSGLVKGLSYKMIADHCSISIDTVRSHIRHIYEKLHVNSKAQAITLAMKHRLI